MLGVEVVASVPSGDGTITSSPSGLNCSSANSETSGCQATFTPGTKVTLTATGAGGDDKKNPPTAWKFGAWGATNTAGREAILGCVGSTSTCTFTIETEVIITASFVGDSSWNSYPDCYAYDTPGQAPYSPRYCTENCAVGAISGSLNLYASIGASSGYNGYCEGDIRSNMMSIGGDKTHSYTFGDSAGRMVPVIACYWRSSTAVWPSSGISEWSSTISASNSVTSTRHWSWGVRMVAYKESQGSTTPGFSIAGGPYCADESGCVHTDPCPAANLQNDMGVTAGSDERSGTAAEPATQSAVGAPARVADDPAVVVRDRIVRSAGTFHMACPAGTSVLHADTAMLSTRRQSIVEPYVNHGARRATFTVRAVPRDARVNLQVVCRSTSAPRHLTEAGHVRGSVRGEVFRSRQRDQHIQAGAGNDHIRARHRGVHVSAGSGNDRVIVSAARVAVMGGPGSDRITSTTPGESLIEGGPGPDVLISRRGRTVINAEDGAGGDMIICAPGSRATVVKDPGDIVRGTCTVRRGG